MDKQVTVFVGQSAIYRFPSAALDCVFGPVLSREVDQSGRSGWGDPGGIEVIPQGGPFLDLDESAHLDAPVCDEVLTAFSASLKDEPA